MPWRPSYPGERPTLGWEVLSWIEANLAAPDRTHYEPLILTKEQAAFVLAFYELDPVTGKRRYRRAVYSRPKGAGKSPLLSAICIAEALGPVVPAGWDADGQPVGRPWSDLRTPWVQIAATSEDQTKNAWTPLLEMLREGPVLDAYPGVDPMDTFVALPKGRIEFVTAAATSREGNRPVHVCLDQALAVGTVIPTPNGWTTMGELKTGDIVYGSAGQPVTVLQAKPVSTEHDCYRVTFADGTSVIASEGHLWYSKVAGSNAAPRIRTTGEMYRDGISGAHALRARRRELIREAIVRDPSMSNMALAHEFGANRKTVAAIRAKLIAEGAVQDVERRGGGPAKLERYRPAAQVVGDKPARRFMIPVAPPQQLPDADLPVPPYLLGYWLGDGTRGKCELSVHADDLAEVQERLRRDGVESWPRRYAQSAKGFAPGSTDQINLTFSRSWGYQGENRPDVAKALAALPCYRDKHVPEEYFRGSIEQRTELLRGLMDSDGSCTREGVCTFVSTLKVLADAVTRLLRSLGQVTSGPRWVEDPRYKNGGKYRVDFTPRAGLVPFGLSRKASRVRGHRRGSGWISITSIEPVERVPVRCIAVDSEDHLFAFGVGGHLTHNTESWTPANGGVKLAATLRRNLGKTGGSSIEAPNAFVPGEESVAEQSAQYLQQILEGKARDEGLLYDHREWPPDTDMTDRESLFNGLAYVYGDSADLPDGCRIHDPPCERRGWVDLDRIIAEIYDPATEPQDARRYFGNEVTHASDAWLSQPEWAACADPSKVVADGERITLGFDGSRHRERGVTDATALIGCRVSDGHLFEIAVWEQPDGPAGKDWWVPVAEVEAAIRSAFQRYRVVGFYADPAADWRSYVADWEYTYGRRLRVRSSQQHPIEWWMSRTTAVVRALEQLHAAIVNRELTHDGSFALTRHMLNARRRPSRAGLTIAKEHPSSRRKIDAAIAAMLAWQARLDAVSKGLGRRGKGRAVVLK